MSDIITVSLDREQMAAAQSDPSRPLLVQAGPGSGKTASLVERIALLRDHQRRRHLASGSIVALTFTRTAAQELAARLNDRLGGETFEGVEVRTFHSFGLRILRDGWAARYLGWPHVQVATRGQMLRAATASIAEAGLDVSVSEALHLIAAAKLGRAEGGACRDQWRGARLAYDTWLHERCLIDVPDMLALPVAILGQHPEARADLQRRVAHVVTDEAQDWTRHQAALVAYAGGPHGHITTVGDAMQSIYPGSSPRYLLEFPRAFRQTRVVSLTRTYRLHAAVLAVAMAIAAHITGAAPAGVSDRGDGPRPLLYLARSADDEADWIVQELHALRQRGAVQRWRDVAVLARTHDQGRHLVQALQSAGIPCRTHASTLAEAATVRSIMGWLALLRDGEDNAALLQAVEALSGAGPSEDRCSLRTALQAGGPWTMERLRHVCPPGLSEVQQRDLARFVRLYDGLAGLAAGNEPSVVVDAVLERTGLEAQLVRSHTRVREQVAALRALVARDGDVGALQHLLAEQEMPDDGDAVRISTVHAFKGREAEVVFVTGLDDGLFPHHRCLQDGEEGLQQELRAVYVAVTRPRTLLYLSTGCAPAPPHASGRPSPFLQLIPAHLLRSA